MLGYYCKLLDAASAGGPVLDLNFLTGALDPRITFYRSSNAMQWNSAGVLVWAPANEFTYSADISASGWSNNGGATRTTGFADPIGGLTACQYGETKSSSSSQKLNGAFAPSVAYRPQVTAIRFKLGNGFAGWARVWVSESNVDTNTLTAWVNLNAGALGTVTPVAGMTGNVTAAIAGNGWVTVTFFHTCTVANTKIAWSSASADNSVTRDKVGAGGNPGIGVNFYVAMPQSNPGQSLLAYVATVDANKYYGPRFDYDPVTKAPLGILSELQRTNLVIRNWSYSANWTLTNCSLSTLVASPDGFTLGQTILDGAVATTSLKNAAGIAVTASTTYTASVLLKRGNTDWVRFWVVDTTTGLVGFQCWVNLNTGAIGATPGALTTGTYTSSFIQDIGNGWYRVALTGQIGSNITLNINTSTAAADNSILNVNGGTYVVLGHQVELGASPSSIIPTYGDYATRPAESFNLTAVGWANQAAMTFVVAAKSGPPGASNGGTFLQLDDGTSANRVGMYLSTMTVEAFSTLASVFSGEPSSGVGISSSQSFKEAFAYSSAGKRVSCNGSAVASSAVVPPVSGYTRLVIGSSWNGWISQIKAFGSVLSDAQLQALST